MSKRDWLAIERTHLANERNMLAYLRSALVMFATGIGLTHIEYFDQVKVLGIVFVIVAPLLIIWGTARYYRRKAKIESYYKDIE